MMCSRIASSSPLSEWRRQHDNKAVGDPHASHSPTPAAKWLAVVTGLAAIILTFFTDHKTGVIRILPFAFHVAVDALVGIVFVTAPFVLGFTGLDAW